MKKACQTCMWVSIALILCAYLLQILWVKTQHKEEIAILGYHHIVEDSVKKQYFADNMWVNSSSSFEAQMKLLKKKGYHSITLDELYAWRMGERTLDDKSIVITFDDGFASSINTAAPILKRYGFTGSVFVIGSQIEANKDKRRLDQRSHATLQEMREAQQLQFYSHSFDLHHKQPDFRVNLWNAQQLQEDTRKEATLVSTRYYAYPYGKYNPTIQNVLQKHGTKLAFGFNENRKATLQDDPYALPRFNVHGFTKLDVFYQMISE